MQVGHQHHAHFALRKTPCIAEDIAQHAVGVGGIACQHRAPHQRRRDAVLQIDAMGNMRFFAFHDAVDVRQLIHAVDEGLELDTGGGADARLQRIA